MIIRRFLVTFIFVSCNNDDDSNLEDASLLGDWKLVGTLIDRGDGSGTFQAVESDKVITFLSDGTFNSNGNI